MRFCFLVFVCLLVSCQPKSEDRGIESSAADALGGAVSFSGDSALVYVAKQVSFGPRVPGTDGHRATAEWIQATLRRHGAEVTTQEFAYTDSSGTQWPLINILGSYSQGAKPPLLLVAHWDTRPWADQDPDPQNRSTPILGANDGGSGVAVLLELARAMQEAEIPRAVDLLFVDGEDLGQPRQPDTFCQGSRYFAANLPRDYHGALVLDMVGDADLSIPIEFHSVNNAPELVDWVWARGEQLAPEIFSRRIQGAIMDDHVPLLEAGIPAIDLIDFDYWAWHTLSDDMSQVSAASLQAVGTVVLSLILDP